jgi:hypothetical protein
MGSWFLHNSHCWLFINFFTDWFSWYAPPVDWKYLPPFSNSLPLFLNERQLNTTLCCITLLHLLFSVNKLIDFYFKFKSYFLLVIRPVNLIETIAWKSTLIFFSKLDKRNTNQNQQGWSRMRQEKCFWIPIFPGL